MIATDGLRLGVTCRVAQAQGYSERRDALAQDWTRFLAAVVPDALWQPLPNEGRAVVRRVERWGINALLLTGGNNVGSDADKDTSDLALLDFALANDLPVFGVCRGLQVFQHYFGGPLADAERERHVARRHDVQVLARGAVPARTQQVNSFHSTAVRADALANGLEPLAVCDDGTIEALRVGRGRAAAVMWHPERDAAADALTLALLRELFGART